eukprot:6319722-Ditylum_brightwellii.AAC.1
MQLLDACNSSSGGTDVVFIPCYCFMYGSSKSCSRMAVLVPMLICAHLIRGGAQQVYYAQAIHCE